MRKIGLFLMLLISTHAFAMGQSRNPDGSLTTWFGAPPSSGGGNVEHPGRPDNPLDHGGVSQHPEAPSAPAKPLSPEELKELRYKQAEIMKSIPPWLVPIRPLTREEEKAQAREQRLQERKVEFEKATALEKARQKKLSSDYETVYEEEDQDEESSYSKHKKFEQGMIRATKLQKAFDQTPYPHEIQVATCSGKFSTGVDHLYRRFTQVHPQTSIQWNAKELGMVTILQADQSAKAYMSLPKNQCQPGLEAEFLLQVSQDFLDLAVGIDPITGFGRSAYELLVGKNLVTGEILSAPERSLALVSLATLNGSKYLSVAGKGMWKVYQGAAHLLKTDHHLARMAFREGKGILQKSRDILQGWQKRHTITRIETAEVVNAADKFEYLGRKTPSYQKGTHVVYFHPEKTSRFVRVYELEKHESSAWMVKKGEILGLTPEQIRVKLNLPQTPRWISDVTIPAKTPMSRGMTNFNEWLKPIEKMEGQVQYRIELPRSEIKPEWFSNKRRLGDRFYGN